MLDYLSGKSMCFFGFQPPAETILPRSPPIPLLTAPITEPSQNYTPVSQTESSSSAGKQKKTTLPLPISSNPENVPPSATVSTAFLPHITSHVSMLRTTPSPQISKVYPFRLDHTCAVWYTPENFYCISYTYDLSFCFPEKKVWNIGSTCGQASCSRIYTIVYGCTWQCQWAETREKAFNHLEARHRSTEKNRPAGNICTAAPS